MKEDSELAYGESTKKEIEYAKSINTEIVYLTPIKHKE